MKFLNLLKAYYFYLPPAEIITRELRQAHLERLEYETAVEHAKACHDLSMARIERLNKRMEEYK